MQELPLEEAAKLADAAVRESLGKAGCRASPPASPTHCRRLALTPTLTLTSQLREYKAEALTNLQIEVASMQIWAKVH